MAAMDAGRFGCSACGKSYAWKAELAGKRVKCKCGAVMTVPASAPEGAATGVAKSPSPVPTSMGPDAIPMKPAKPVEKVRPVVQKPTPAAPVAPEEDEGPPPGFEDMFALAGDMQAEVAPPLPVAVPGAGCPSCGATVAAGAVICVKCGHNLKTGKKLKTAKGGAGGGGGGSGARPAMAGAGGGNAGVLGYAGAKKRGDEEEGESVFSAGKELYLPIALVILGTVLTYLQVVYVRKVSSPGMAIGMVGVLTLINFVLATAGVLISKARG